jgi:uncharacterized protein (UPF0218 family)
MYVLPDHLRELLREPLGELVDEQGLLTMLQQEQSVVSVGDQVTYTLLHHGFQPLFCIVDFHIKRNKYPPAMKQVIRSFGRKHQIVQNPPGVITDELWNAIAAAYHDVQPGLLRLEVKGEEDLAALPAIYLAPEDVTVIYGLPDKGVVVVKATPESRQKVKEILDMM